jgi:hypothetical protein
MILILDLTLLPHLGAYLSDGEAWRFQMQRKTLGRRFYIKSLSKHSTSFWTRYSKRKKTSRWMLQRPSLIGKDTDIFTQPLNLNNGLPRRKQKRKRRKERFLHPHLHLHQYLNKSGPPSQRSKSRKFASGLWKNC